jgi:hypothetical protein
VVVRYKNPNLIPWGHAQWEGLVSACERRPCSAVVCACGVCVNARARTRRGGPVRLRCQRRRRHGNVRSNAWQRVTWRCPCVGFAGHCSHSHRPNEPAGSAGDASRGGACELAGSVSIVNGVHVASLLCCRQGRLSFTAYTGGDHKICIHMNATRPYERVMVRRRESRADRRCMSCLYAWSCLPVWS